jgi:hypothetical protein
MDQNHQQIKIHQNGIHIHLTLPISMRLLQNNPLTTRIIHDHLKIMIRKVLASLLDQVDQEQNDISTMMVDQMYIADNLDTAVSED